MNAFLRNLRDGLSETDLNVLTDSGVTSMEGLHALVTTFGKSLSSRGVNVAKLHNISIPRQAGFATRPSAPAKTRRHVDGARAPAGALLPIGSVKPPGSGRLGASGHGGSTAGRAAGAGTGGAGGGAGGGGNGNGPGSFGPLDFRGPHGVRDQGERGTCVAHALAAVREYNCPGAGNVKLSPQFLFWATKQRDPWKDKDPTNLGYAMDALAVDGVCEEAAWAYDPRFDPHNVSHSPPPGPALQLAKAYAHQTQYEKITSTTGNAAKLYAALIHTQAPVAIALPVYADSMADADNNNWWQPLAEHYGMVIDPPPGALAVSGHAVCVTGFIPDSLESLGGYFVFRNSWGTTWAASARRAPAGLDKSPEPGYGCVSAKYVDETLWEICRLDRAASTLTP